MKQARNVREREERMDKAGAKDAEMMEYTADRKSSCGIDGVQNIFEDVYRFYIVVSKVIKRIYIYRARSL